MSTIIGFIEFVLFLGFLLGLTLMITLAMPQSKMRDVCLQVAGWGLAGFCLLFVVNPIDIPGPFDDVVAAAVGVVSAVQAWQAGERGKAGNRKQVAA